MLQVASYSGNHGLIRRKHAVAEAPIGKKMSSDRNEQYSEVSVPREGLLTQTD
jgi:hypothetical protein